MLRFILVWKSRQGHMFVLVVSDPDDEAELRHPGTVSYRLRRLPPQGRGRGCKPDPCCDCPSIVRGFPTRPAHIPKCGLDSGSAQAHWRAARRSLPTRRKRGSRTIPGRPATRRTASRGEHALSQTATGGGGSCSNHLMTPSMSVFLKLRQLFLAVVGQPSGRALRTV